MAARPARRSAAALPPAAAVAARGSPLAEGALREKSRSVREVGAAPHPLHGLAGGTEPFQSFSSLSGVAALIVVRLRRCSAGTQCDCKGHKGG